MCQSLTVAVKELMPMIFTIEELTNCSLKGQKGGKSSKHQRPAFDANPHTPTGRVYPDSSHPEYEHVLLPRNYVHYMDAYFVES